METMNRKKVLELIKQKSISAEQGLELIKLMENDSRKNDSVDIAVIGIACKLPGANDPDSLWSNLKNGVCSVKDISADRFTEGIDGIYCKKAGMLDSINKFDPLFFSISPKEAEIMDPQQRIFLEECWKLFEDAGYSPAELRGSRCGVFAGAVSGDYLSVLKDAELENEGDALLGMAPSILASRIAYYLDLKGPSISVETACSSSLSALHMACMNIREGTCDMAIAGGISLFPDTGLLRRACNLNMLSPSGVCSPFDNSADGTVLSEGAALVLLKPVDKALRDKDHIYGIIKGISINQDGKTNGITAPSISSQSELEKSVYRKYGIDPERIIYIEAHGTGTELGDPIEIKALSEAFREFTDRKNYCAVGSVKSNIGHCTIASGVAGLIKLLLCMKNGEIPATLNYTSPNEHIDFEGSPFYVADKKQKIEAGKGKSYLMVLSAFGFSGTNCHLVVENHSEEHSASDDIRSLILLSGRKKKQLRARIDSLREYIRNNMQELRLQDISYTLAMGREHMAVRYGFWCSSIGELLEKLGCIADEEFCDINSAGKVTVSEDETIKEFYSVKEPDFGKLFESRECFRISLPTYEFEENVYWPKRKEALQPVGEKASVTGRRSSTDSKDMISSAIMNALKKVLRVSDDDIFGDIPFAEYGMDSITVIDIINSINSELGIELSKTALFNYSTLNVLTEHISEKFVIDNDTVSKSDELTAESVTNDENDEIAVIGISLNFPDAPDQRIFWENLRSGRNSVRDVTRWKEEDYYSSDNRKNTSYSKWGALIDDISLFDEAFFHVTPKEAEEMDPQQRLFLMEAYNAFVDAGYRSDELYGSDCGVFVGCGSSEYGTAIGSKADKHNAHFFLGNISSVLAARISYFLNLRGVNIAVDTACSSSLVAIDMACESLRNHKCSIALAGGVYLIPSSDFYVSTSNAKMLSPTGKCHTFDNSADGFVPGEGAAAVILKPLKQAIKDKDDIYAVICGSGCNYDGKTNGITSPSGPSQSELVRDVYSVYGITPDRIGYVEAHGSGTKLGDPIEVDALSEVFGKYSDEKQFCAIGSVKTNIGHLLSASGIAGFIKAVLCVKNSLYVPSLNFEQANENIDFANSPFYVNTETRPWRSDDRLAAVSAFGVSGTNAHVVIRDHKDNRSPSPVKKHYLFVFSAKAKVSLEKALGQMVIWLEDNNEVSPFEVSASLIGCRDQHGFRKAFAADGISGLTAQLKSFLSDIGREYHVIKRKRETVDITELYLNNADVTSETVQKLADDFENGTDLTIAKEFNKISMPAYQFDLKPFWSGEKKQPVHFYGKQFTETPYNGGNTIKGSHNCLVISNSRISDSVSEHFHSKNGYTTVDVCDLSRMAGLIDMSAYDTVIDLADIESNENGNCADRLEFLKSFIAGNKKKTVYVFHFTTGLFPFDNEKVSADGAELTGVYKLLGAECRRSIIKTVDTDVFDISSITEIAAFEIENDTEVTEVCYRRNKRFIPTVSELVLSSEKAVFRKIGTYIITGAAGDIGIQIIKHLISRGVRNIAAFIHSRDIPVEIMVYAAKNDTKIDQYRVDLSDSRAVADAVSNIRCRSHVNGVIHCAGCVGSSTPSFLQKSVSDFEKTFAPKISGTRNLYNALRDAELDFFVMFSSVSAFIPELGAGVMDYASANAFSEYFAEYIAASFNGVHAVFWPVWSDTAMGALKTSKFYDMGFRSISYDEGLDILDRVIASDATVVLPVLGDDFDMQKAFSVSPRQLASEIFEVRKEKSCGTSDSLEKTVMEAISAETGMEYIDYDDDFYDLGIDSIIMIDVMQVLEEKLDIVMDPAAFVDYPSIRKMSDYIRNNFEVETQPAEQDISVETVREDIRSSVTSGDDQADKKKKIAVIGMACHFPKSENIQGFWEKIVNGIDCISEIPSSRWDWREYYSDSHCKGKTISRWGGFIDNIELFDPGFFNISENDAIYLDPLVRQFLEVTAETFDDAGYTREEIAGRKISVIAGARSGPFSEKYHTDSAHSITGMGQNFIVAHVAQFLDLKGPAFTVDSACSSSLMSIHLGCRSILNGEAEMAVVGGTEILLDEKPYILLSSAKALSPDGKCYTFDERANGFVPGEGCGAVLLKEYESAVRDGDKIYAVIEASAANNDGKTMGITTPNLKAQKEMILTALDRADIDPSTIGYVETHGTGTMIGDPIELKALSEVYSSFCDKKRYCAVGSVKTNIGHLMSAAGVSGLIKTALAIHNRIIPPTLNCITPNPRFRFDDSPFYVADKAEKWDSDRRAAISSFGFGGTNVHMILSSAPDGYIPRRCALRQIAYNKKRYWPEQGRIERSPADRMLRIHKVY